MVVVVAVAALIRPAAARAQLPTLDQAVDAVTDQQEPRRLTIAGQIGAFASTDWSDRVILGSIGRGGILEQVVIEDLGVEPATTFDAVVTYWIGRWGFRVHGGFTSTCVAAGGRCPATAGSDVNVWTFDVGGAYSLRNPRSLFRPFVFAGAGAVAYDAAQPIGPSFFSATRGVPSGGGPPFFVRDPSTEFLLTVDEVNLDVEPAFTVGVGADIRLPIGGGGVGLRLEVADHISSSPVDLRLTPIGVPFVGGVRTDVDFGAVHHFRAQVGIVIDVPLR